VERRLRLFAYGISMRQDRGRKKSANPVIDGRLADPSREPKPLKKARNVCSGSKD
jgi:hypothetical protein